MNVKLSKQEIEREIREVFSKNPNPNKIKKIKKLAMSKNIKLKEFRKKFCKKCYSLFNIDNSEIRIKNRIKIIKCKNCNFISRYKLK